ncbi:hypothetical protein EB796_008320 [Bugula neritina]|uniref:Uncharacterized protein n=1 Tax=Bugula neritina TaxID=10212 RepID=A0A7J7K629_BUGNE|nr:hypothetical protein EB796_008320 [Bugula neritina]
MTLHTRHNRNIVFFYSIFNKSYWSKGELQLFFSYSSSCFPFLITSAAFFVGLVLIYLDKCGINYNKF